MTGHTTRRYGDQYHCSVCRRSWDVGEDAPAECEAPPPTPPVSVGYKNEYKHPVETPSRMATSQDFADLREALDTNDWSKFKDR